MRYARTLLGARPAAAGWIIALTAALAGLAPCGWAKPTPPVELSIATDEADLVPGGTATVILSFTPGTDVARAEIQFESSSDDVVITGPVTAAFGALPAGTLHNASTSIHFAGNGKTEVRGWFYAFDENNALLFGRSRALYVVATPDSVLAGSTSFVDIEIAEAKRLRQEKALSENAYQERIRRIIGGKAAGQVDVRATTGGSKAVFAVGGNISWTDPSGTEQYLRSPISVEIWEKNAGGDELITTVTAYYSSYQASIENVDPEGPGGRDIYVRIKSESAYARIYNVGTGNTYFLESPVVSDIADGAYVQINLKANNTNTPDRAFGVLDAFQLIAEYVSYYLGGALNKIDVDFPTGQSTSNYSGGKLHILMDDWIDWDVIHHEYGHYFMDVRNIENNPGGAHALNENLGERVGKDAGIRLAWGEGFPTYFGTSGQAVWGWAYSSVPNVRDTFYTDTIDSTIHYDLEGNAGAPSMGEDNEISVQRILWDLYDSNPDGEDRVALGDGPVYTAATSVNATTLSQFWNGLIAAKAATMRQKVDYGCIFGEHNAAPELTAPDDNVELPGSGSPPTFTWEANGGGPSHRNNRFRVQFWRDNFSAMIFESEELTNTSYTPSNADWDTIIAGDKVARWVVLGRNTDAPETGTYVSCSRRFGQADIAFVIDDTGSMGEEIGGVKAALLAFIDLIDLLGGEVTIHLETFKDDVTSRIMSSNLAEVAAEVNVLYADGGGDCPEASVQALNAVAPTLKPGSTILLATDADAHLGLDIGATIAALRAKGLRVHVLLSGSCSEYYKSSSGAGIPPSLNCPVCPAEEKDGYPSAAIALFSTLAAETGGIFAFVPDVNSYEPEGATRYENTAFNVMKATSLPSIPLVTPPFGYAGATFTVTIMGANTNFNASSVVTFSGEGITVNSGGATSPISYTANITIASGAEPGFRDVTVTTSFGKAGIEEAVGAGAFEVKGAITDPVILGINPAQVTVGATLDVDVYGANTNFAEDSSVDFGFAITVNSVTVLSTTHLRANITVSESASLGYYSVSVYTASNDETAGESVPGPLLITAAVTGAIPRIISVTPGSSIRNRTLNVNVVGENTNFADGVSVGSMSGGGVTVLSTTVEDTTHAALSVQIAPDAAPGFRDVYVTTGDEVAAILDAFEILGALLVADAGPDQTVRTLTGSAEVTLDGSGSSSAGDPITDYFWTGDPDPEDVVAPVVTVPLGVHEFTLIVGANGALSAPDTVVITVRNATDINGDGVVNSVDVQLTILGALEIPVSEVTDVNGDGVTTSVDVQLTILGALA